MTLKLVLYVLVAILLVLAGAIVTGQFDVHPAFGMAVALGAVGIAAWMIRKKRD